MKGLDYVAIDPGIAKDKKVLAIARALRKDRRWVAGIFPEFLGHVAEHQPDGNLGEVDDDTLDVWAGDVTGFGALVRELMCDTTGQLIAWWRYNGRALEQLRKDRERKRDFPKKRRGDAGEFPRNDDGNQSEGGEDTPPQVRAGSSPLTVTVTDTVTETENRASSARAWPDRVRRFLDEVERDAPAVLAAFEQAFSDVNDPDTLARHLHAFQHGLGSSGGAAVPLDVIGQALSDMDFNNEPLNAQRMRVFCNRIIAQRKAKLGGVEQSPGERAYAMAMAAARE